MFFLRCFRPGADRAVACAHSPTVRCIAHKAVTTSTAGLEPGLPPSALTLSARRWPIIIYRPELAFGHGLQVTDGHGLQATDGHRWPGHVCCRVSHVLQVKFDTQGCRATAACVGTTSDSCQFNFIGTLHRAALFKRHREGHACWRTSTSGWRTPPPFGLRLADALQPSHWIDQPLLSRVLASTLGTASGCCLGTTQPTYHPWKVARNNGTVFLRNNEKCFNKASFRDCRSEWA